MKLLMKRAFTVVLAAVLLFGCGEDNNKTGGNELTPQENKAKLEQCAMEVLGKINPQDHKTLVETIDAFAYKADYGLFEDEIGPTPGEGIEPNPMGMMSVIRKAVTTYNPVVLSVLATEVDYIAIPTGIYTFDEVAREWVETPSAEVLEFVFEVEGAESSISIRKSGKETQIQTDENTIVFVPEHVTMTVNKGADKLAELSVNNTTLDINSLKFDSEIALKTNADYTWAVHVDISPSEAVASASMEIASANIVSVVAGLQLDASKVNPQMTEDDLIASILSVTTTSVVNSQLMVAGTAPKIQEMIYALNNINASTDKEYAIAEAAVYNQYMDVNMQYTGDGVPFASVEAQPYLEYEYSYGDTHYEYYEVEPVIVFASDNSRYSFEEYFNEADFGNVLQSVMTLCDQFVSFVKYCK